MARIADVSAAQSIWFVRRAPPVAAHLDGYRRIDVWYERVKAFGHGTHEDMARRLGKSRTAITESLSLNNMPA